MKITWSHSALKDYENCARKYHEVRVLKNYKQDSTEQIRYGEELHKAAEEYVTGTPLPQQFDFIQPTLDALLAKEGTKHAELKLALDVDLQPCDWFSKDTWVRGIVDLLILDTENKTAWVVDYKTGNNKYPDKEQLDLMALLTFAIYPEIEQVNAALLFVVKNSITKHKVVRAEADALWWRYRERIAKIAASHTHSVWNPKQSGLCPWCPVRTCEFHPKH
jgi:hypothetical protein